MVTTLLVVFLGSGVGAGILGLACAMRRLRPGSPKAPRHQRALPAASHFGTDTGHWRGIRRWGTSTAFGLLCIVITRWPVAGILGAVAFATVPSSLRKVLPGSTSVKAEAVATWTELIRDSMASSAGLAQAIVVTAPSAPAAIRSQVGALATRLTNGITLEAALRSFALDVDDPGADFLVCALLLAATSRAQKLVEVLSSLAEAIREEVSMRLRVDASRAAARSSVRTVVLFSLGFAGTLVVVAHSYLSPFGSGIGQLVLGIVGLFYAVGLALMVRLIRPTPEIRLLDAEGVR